MAAQEGDTPGDTLGTELNSSDILAVIRQSVQNLPKTKEIQFLQDSADLSQDVCIQKTPPGYHGNSAVRVTSTDEQHSVIFVLPHRQDSSDKEHMDRELQAMKTFQTACPGAAPRIIGTDSKTNTYILEDLIGYSLLREQLIGEQVDKVAIQQLGYILGRLQQDTCLTSHTGSASKHQHQQQQQQLEALMNNPGVERIVTDVFLQPFTPNMELTSKCSQSVMSELTQIWNSESLKSTVLELKTKFLTKKECLVHGNFNAGSILVKEGVPKVVSFERGHIGPCAYDLASLLADFFVTYHYHMLIPEDNDRHRRVSYKMMEIPSTIVETYLEQLKCRQGVDKEEWVQETMKDVAGFTACQLISRVTHKEARRAWDLHTPGVELEVLQSAVRLLRVCQNIDNIGRLVFIALALC